MLESCSNFHQINLIVYVLDLWPRIFYIATATSMVRVSFSLIFNIFTIFQLGSRSRHGFASANNTPIFNAGRSIIPSIPSAHSMTNTMWKHFQLSLAMVTMTNTRIKS